MPNIVNATMYGTCAATDSPFATTTAEPITAKPKKTAKPIHGHRAGGVPIRPADADTAHRHGPPAAPQRTMTIRRGLHVPRRGNGPSRTVALSPLGTALQARSN